MDPTSTGAGGFVALKTVLVQTIIASLAGLLGFVLIRPRTVREAVWRFFGAAISSVIFGPFVVAAVHSVWPDLLASATLDRLRHNAYCLVLDGKSYRSPRLGPTTTLGKEEKNDVKNT